MIQTPDAAELFAWLCHQISDDPKENKKGIYSPRKFAKVTNVEPRKVRIDIKAAYSIHFDRCRFGYCGQVEEWLTHRTAHRATWNRIIDDGAIQIGENGIVRIV